MKWMHDERQRSEWDRTAHLMSTYAACQPGGKWINPNRFNPYYVEPPKTPAQEASESRTAFAMLGRALKDIAGVA